MWRFDRRKWQLVTEQRLSNPIWSVRNARAAPACLWYKSSRGTIRPPTWSWNPDRYFPRSWSHPATAASGAIGGVEAAAPTRRAAPNDTFRKWLARGWG